MPYRSLIDVSAPYYALQKVHSPSAGIVHARVSREQPLGHEVGPIASAEVGRHLAIAGACACSSVREPVAQHYYLAHRATIVRHSDSGIEHATEFDVRAHAVSSTAREAHALTSLRLAGAEQPLYELDVTYKVLARPVFQRLFAAHRRDLRAAPRDAAANADPQASARRVNPYLKALPLQFTQRSAHGVRASLPEVKPEMCSGHFPMYPALPIAILMHTLSSLCGEAMRARRDDSPRYQLQRAEVYADQLAFAGERLEFDARYIGAAPHGEQYEARVHDVTGKQLGRLVLDLVPVVSTRSHQHAPRSIESLLQ